ncbi:MAG: hypothetical protein GF409_00315 [Candidatus Omnitrophica bacterium]|nr:hypothetical protein [Candidatus Omnitrophota bacterium]
MLKLKKRYIFCLLLAVCLLGVTAVYVFSDHFIKLAGIRLMENLSGAPVEMESLSFDPEEHIIHITGFKIHNPAGFPDGTLIDISKIALRGVSIDMEHGKIPVGFADIEIDELNVIRNESGRLNIDELRFVKEGREKGLHLSDILPIDTFEFSMEKVLYTDYSREGEAPFFRVFDVQIKDRKYSDMLDVMDLLIIIFHEAVGETTIKGAAVAGLLTIGGAGLLPVGAGFLVLGKDSATAEFPDRPEDIFIKSVEIIDRLGRRTKTRKVEHHRIIRAIIEGHNVIVKIRESGGASCRMTVYARKFLIPQPHFASTVLYQISRDLGCPD